MREHHARFHRHAPRAPPLVLRRRLRRANQPQQPLFIDRLVQKKTRARLESLRHRRRPLIVADQNDRRHAIERRVAHLPRQLRPIGRSHAQRKKRHRELSFAQNLRRFRTAIQRQRIDAHRREHFFDEFACFRFRIDDQSSLLHRCIARFRKERIFLTSA